MTEVPSPLVDIRSRLVNRADTELFVVRATEPAYWRVSGLASFDGSTWSLPERDDRTSRTTSWRMPLRARGRTTRRS